MPTYTFRCPKCKDRVEALMPHSELAKGVVPLCPVCGLPCMYTVSAAQALCGLPTKKFHGAMDKDHDPGFQHEWATVQSDPRREGGD